MKFSCTQENLNQGLSIVSHIAGKSTALPILNNVLLKASKEGVKLVATNLEIGVEKTIRGKVEVEGDFTVDARLLNDFVGLLPKERVDLMLDGQDLVVKSKNSKTKIKGLAADEFPLLPQVDREDGAICENRVFKKALSQVIFATSTDETRPEISGVLLNFKNKELIMVATDSYRLAEKKIVLKKFFSEDKKVIIPTKTLQELTHILAEEEGGSSLEIYLGENQVLFSVNETNLVSRVIEGQYPDYEQIIPREQKTKIIAETSEFVKIVKMVSLFCKAGINDLNLRFLPIEEEVIVSGVNMQVGENVSRLSVKINGPENETIFNWRYLLDGLNNIDTEEVSLEIIDNTNPGVLKPTGTQDYLYIVMPIKQ